MPTNPIPVPMSPVSAATLGAVKNPTRDVVNMSSLIQTADAESMTALLFEGMSAIELADLIRYDTITGIDQKYSIISNISTVKETYGILQRLTPSNKLSSISGKYAIDLNSKIPNEIYIENNNLNATNSYVDIDETVISVEKNYVYIDLNGDLIIELDGITGTNYSVEVEIDTNGTIYEVEY